MNLLLFVICVIAFNLALWVAQNGGRDGLSVWATLRQPIVVVATAVAVATTIFLPGEIGQMTPHLALVTAGPVVGYYAGRSYRKRHSKSTKR